MNNTSTENNACESGVTQPAVAAKAAKRRARMRFAVLAGSALSLLAVVAGSAAQEMTAATQPASADSAPANAKPGAGPLLSDGFDNQGRLRLMVGKSLVMTTRVPYKRVNVAQPEVADVTPIGPTSILLTAKKAGNTQVMLWDDSDRSQVVDVVVEFDLQALQEQYKTMFADSKIEVASANGAIVLRGRVANLQTAERAAEIAAPYGAKVLNFLEISGGQQVMLQVRFAEVARTVSNAFAFNVTAADGIASGGTILGPASNVTGNGVNLFGTGQIGNSAFQFYIEALRTNNLLRTLAEPNVTAISGQEASFLAGGEVPIPVPQSSNGGSTITIEYKQFGVKLNFLPVVLGDGKIRLKVEPEVSDLDYSHAVTFQGFVIPTINKRTLQTTVEMNEGQTLALAGLLNNSLNATKSVTPLLGDIPVLGALFRSTNYQRSQTELVVMVTPRLVEAVNPGHIVKLPGEKWRDPSEGQLFFDADLGGPENTATTSQPADHLPPRFHGSYGFTPVKVDATTGPTAAAVDTDGEDMSASAE